MAYPSVWRCEDQHVERERRLERSGMERGLWYRREAGKDRAELANAKPGKTPDREGPTDPRYRGEARAGVEK